MEKNGIRFGLIIGLVQVILVMIMYFVNPKMIFSLWVALFSFVILYIGGMIKVVVEERRDKGGFITFKEGFTQAFIFALIVSVVGGVFNYVLFNFIDNGLVDLQMEKTIEMLANWMQGDQLEEAIDRIKREDFGLTPSRLLGVIGGNIVMLSVIGAIISAIMKKEKPAHLQTLEGEEQ